MQNKGIRYGILFGLSTIVIGLILYFINKPLFLQPTLKFILSIALPVVFMLQAAIQTRKDQNGFLTFAEALKPAYLTLVIGVIIFGVFQYILMSSDPQLLDIQKEIAVASLEKLSGLANLSEEDLANMEEIDPASLKPNPRAFFMMLSKNLILGFILAVIIAFIVKRKKPSIE